MAEEVSSLTVDEYNKLLTAIESLPTRLVISKERLKLLFKVVYEAALRISEALSLTPSCLNHKHQRLVLAHTKGGYIRCTKCHNKKTKDGDKVIFARDGCTKCGGRGKLARFAEACVSPELFKTLVDIAKDMKPDERIFPITRQTAWKTIKKMAEIAKIEVPHARQDQMRTNAFCHLLRHSRAVHLLDQGLLINEVQTKLRHRNIATTSVYTKVNIGGVQKKEFNLS